MKLLCLSPLLLAAVSANQYDPTPARKKGGNTRALKGSSGSRSKSGSIGVCDDIYPELDYEFKQEAGDDANWRDLCTISGWRDLFIEEGDVVAPPFIFGPLTSVYNELIGKSLYDACVCNSVFEHKCLDDGDGQGIVNTCKKVSALADLTGIWYFPGAGGSEQLGNNCTWFPERRHLAAGKEKMSFKEFSLSVEHDRKLGGDDLCDEFDFEALLNTLTSLADKDMDQCAFLCLQEYTYLPYYYGPGR